MSNASRTVGSKWGELVKDDRLVSLFELNDEMVDMSRFGPTLKLPPVPYSHGRLKKREFVFRAGKPGLVRDHLMKPSKYHPDRIQIIERVAVKPEGFPGEEAKA